MPENRKSIYFSENQNNKRVFISSVPSHVLVHSSSESDAVSSSSLSDPPVFISEVNIEIENSDIACYRSYIYKTCSIKTSIINNPPLNYCPSIVTSIYMYTSTNYVVV